MYWNGSSNNKEYKILLHYLDDFITIGPPDTAQCGTNMQKLCELCAKLGILVATEKTLCPTTCLTFLGIEVDTIQLEICLPQDKLQRVKQMINDWMGQKAARRHELESLLGLLQHAVKVVSLGRRFVRRTIQTLTGVKKRDHHVRLGAEMHLDLLCCPSSAAIRRPTTKTPLFQGLIPVIPQL